MNKKYIIIGAVVAAIAFFAMCGKAEAQEVEQEKKLAQERQGIMEKARKEREEDEFEEQVDSARFHLQFVMENVSSHYTHAYLVVTTCRQEFREVRQNSFDHCVVFVEA